MRLIDADELKKRAEEVCFSDMPDCGNFYAVGVSDIDIMPTIYPESLRPTAKQQLVDEYASKYLCATCEWKNGNICTLPRCMKLEERRANDQRRIQPKESVAMEIPTQQES